MLTELSDEELMLAYANGNLEAFDILYGRHETPLFRFLCKRVDGKATAEEIFQEVWSKVIKAKDNYKVTATFYTYIYQIARNALIDHYRKKHTESLKSTDLGEGFVIGQVPAANDPFIEIESQQRYIRIIDAIKELPPSQQDVFLLKEEVALSIREIASILNINEETCKSKLRYARNRLRELLGKDNSEADDEQG